MTDTTQPSWCPPTPPAPPVQDCRQLVGSEDVATSICHTGWTPILLTGFLRDLLTRHFTKQNIVEPDLRTLIWQEAPSSGIMIESVWRWRPDMVDKRPAVLIKRNGMKNTRLSLNDRARSDSGGDNYETMWVGSHTLFCLHMSGAACEVLATEVQTELTEQAPQLVNNLSLMMLRVTEEGPVSSVEESTQNYVVPITLAWAYSECWQLRPDNLPMKRITLTMDMLRG